METAIKGRRKVTCTVTFSLWSRIQKRKRSMYHQSKGKRRLRYHSTSPPTAYFFFFGVRRRPYSMDLLSTWRLRFRVVHIQFMNKLHGIMGIYSIIPTLTYRVSTTSSSFRYSLNTSCAFPLTLSPTLSLSLTLNMYIRNVPLTRIVIYYLI